MNRRDSEPVKDLPAFVRKQFPSVGVPPWKDRVLKSLPIDGTFDLIIPFIAAVCGALLLWLPGADIARAETGAEAWLRYAPVERNAARPYANLPASLFVLGSSSLLNSAKAELIRGLHGMLGKTLEESGSREKAFVLGLCPPPKRAASSL